MADKEYTFENLEAEDIPNELKAALKAVSQASQALVHTIERFQGLILNRLLNKLPEEAINPEVDTYFWETTLDLWNKVARQVGEDGAIFLEASGRLVPLMQERVGPYEGVTLREITGDTMLGICELSETLTPPKRYMVAPNLISLAQAHFNPHAWFRAIYAGKAAVGFVMIVDNDEEPEYFLWRYMIAEPFQGRGFGAQGIQRLVEYVRTRPGAKELLVSCGEGEGSPEGFYKKQGFIPTGEKIGDEIVLRLELDKVEAVTPPAG